MGLCGCGNMGAAIATRLATGSSLAVYDVDADRRRGVATDLSVKEVSDLEGLAAHAKVIVLSLPSPAISRSVVTGLLRHLRADSIIIETSTLNPSDMTDMAGPCADAGVSLLDAAVLSGVAQMAVGDSMLLIGGSDEAVAAAQSVLDLLTPRQLHLGRLGTGMAAKVANNAVSHAVMVVLLEAASMAAVAGVPLDQFGAILSEPDAGLIRPLQHRLLERVLHGDYAGGMPTDAARKDSVLALELAHQTGVPLFAIQAAHTPYELAVATGHARLDYAALALLWEGWIGRRLGSAADQG